MFLKKLVQIVQSAGITRGYSGLAGYADVNAGGCDSGCRGVGTGGLQEVLGVILFFVFSGGAKGL